MSRDFFFWRIVETEGNPLDLICDPNLAQELESHIRSGAEFVVLENSGHFPYVERAEEFQDLTKNFLIKR